MAGVFTEMIEVAIQGATPEDREKLQVALEMMTAVGTRIGAEIDAETGQAVLKAQDEAGLLNVVEQLRRDLGIVVIVGHPQCAFRETPGIRSEIDYTYKRQSGGSGEFARVKLVFEPGKPGSGYGFVSEIVDDAVPREFVRGVKKGLDAARKTGVLAGFPVIDFKATLVDGAYHHVDSSVHAFEIAAHIAFKKGLQKARCTLLEPIMLVKIAIPVGFEEEIVADLDLRRAERPWSVETRDKMQIVRALVPLANMFGYANTLRTMTHGRAIHVMTFDHYAPVPMKPDDGPFRPAVGMRA